MSLNCSKKLYKKPGQLDLAMLSILSVEDMFDGFSGDDGWYRNYCVSNMKRIASDSLFVASHLNSGDRLLDVGAVPPLMVAMLRRLGFSNLSISDPSENHFSSFCSKHNIDYVQDDLLNNHFRDPIEQFDFVCLNEVIEHLAGNLIIAVESVAMCVRPGGHLLVTTPNLRSLSGLVALLLYSSGLASKPRETVLAQYKRASAKWGYFGHVREYTTKETTDLVESFGFELVAIKMQPNYLDLGGLFRIVKAAERFTPSWRLFGKYLFRKNN